jgi:alkylated DNA repair dioxygenase AlkB
MPHFMMPFLHKAEEICDYKFNAVLLNLYRNGQDSMGWHADNEPEIDQACIASINIGASRKFKIRKTKDHSEKADFILTHGSLLIMKDAQKDWQHSVPKTKKNIGPRINMTFRRIIS